MPSVIIGLDLRCWFTLRFVGFVVLENVEVAFLISSNLYCSLNVNSCKLYATDTNTILSLVRFVFVEK